MSDSSTSMDGMLTAAGRTPFGAAVGLEGGMLEGAALGAAELGCGELELGRGELEGALGVDACADSVESEDDVAASPAAPQAPRLSPSARAAATPRGSRRTLTSTRR
ncbi:hypothetical protein [Nesterenkonia aurantiaca]|uniref:Uncharacterized protein n=1 Tax=Nesterenkonia aurantiaca TaxID=1436010 RepID=A0A4R7G3U8_9MICC|nr:hypothetical protein [Nesterenkonia aurantiaca]TDS85838.1 hypothetical protein EV640_105190 [Nesterenkonia aurantiaca]